MALLTSCNEGTPGISLFVENAGGPSQPIISGNPVQIGTGGPVVSVSGNTDIITATGASGVLQLGNGGLANCMTFGPGQQATLTSQVVMVPNANLQVGQFCQIIVNPDPAIGPGAGSGLLSVNTNGRLEIIAGGILDFNNAGAQSATYTATTLVGNCPNGVTTPVANPAGLPSGTYAVMMAAVDNDTQFSYQASAMAVWDAAGGNWTAGGVGSGHNAGGFVQLAPIQTRATLAVENFLGASVALTNISVVFKMLAAGA